MAWARRRPILVTGSMIWLCTPTSIPSVARSVSGGAVFFGVAMTRGTIWSVSGFLQGLYAPWAMELPADQCIGGAIAGGVGELAC